MRRTLILTAVGTIALSIGLGVGATLASANPAPPSRTVATTNKGNDIKNAMHDAMPMHTADHMAHHQGNQP